MGKRKREAEAGNSPIAHKKAKEESEDDSDSSHFSLPEELYNDAYDSLSPNSQAKLDYPREKNTKNAESDGDSSEDTSPEKLQNDARVSPKSSAKLNKSDGKQRKSVSFQVFEQEISNADLEVSSKHNGSIEEKSPKKRVSNGLPWEHSSDYVFYLVRKPVDVSLDDLQKISLPTEIGKNKKLKLKTDKGNYNFKASETDRQLFYFPQTTIISAKDSQNIKTGGVINAQVVVTPVIKNIPGGKLFGVGEEVPDDMDLEYEIKSVGKKPSLKLDDKQERLIAFGLKPKKKKSRKSKSKAD